MYRIYEIVHLVGVFKTFYYFVIYQNVHAVFEATVLSTDENGYWYLQKDTSVIEPLENLFKMEDLFSAPRLKNARDIDYKNVYLAPYDGIIKGRVKVLHFVDTFEVLTYYFYILFASNGRIKSQ